MFNYKENIFFYSVYWLVLVLLLLLVQISSALAKPVAVGRVLMATLGVTAETLAAESRVLTRRSAIFVGDTLKVPAGGRAQVRMADGEMISLMESSELFIEDFQYNGNEIDTNVKNLVTGGLRVITGAVKGKNYEMKSRAGTIGIRGTSFEAFTQQGKNLYVRMLSGRIYVINQQGGVEVGFNQLLSAVRIVSLTSAPEAIQPGQLPEIFQRLFLKNTSLSSAGSRQQASQDQQPALGLFKQAQQEQNQQFGIGQPDLNDPTNQQLAREQAAREEAAREQAAREEAAREEAAREEAAREEAAREEAAREEAAREEAAREEAAREQAAREEAAREQAEREKNQSLGYLVGTDYGAAIVYAGQFTEEAVTINSSTDSYQAMGESGTSVLDVTNTLIDFDFNSYDLEKFTLGDSTIHLGNTGHLMDSNGLLLETASAVFATNVHNTSGNLPSSNSYRYELISLNGPLKSGALDVNFSTGNMDIELLKKDRVDSFIGSGSISNFYNASINLVKENDGAQGEITGRFVGGNVEGAIATYKLNFYDADYIGVAVFDRTNTYPIYQEVPEVNFGYTFGKGASQLYAGSFMNTPVMISEDGSRSSIYGSEGGAVLGLGLVDSFDFYIDTNIYTLDYSDVVMGFSEAINATGSRLEINYPPESLDSSGFIFATNVHNTLSTLPSLNQHYTYDLISAKGSAGAAGGLSSASLTVNFSTGAMGVSLLALDNEYTGTGQVADFYSTAINLNSDTLGYTGSINGRFIGTDAEGAITLYSLASNAIDPITGVAIFDRMITPPPPPIGDFGYVFTLKDGQAYGGGFVGMPENPQEGVGIEVVGSDGIALADPNLALINSFDFLIGTRLVELPYSAIYVGGAPLLGSGSEFKINGQEEIAWEGGIVFATNVHNTIDTLPTLDHDYTYNLLSGVLGASGLESGYMQVNFYTGQMSFNLDSPGYGRTYDGQGNIAQFYNDFISLQDSQNEMFKGSITGRFIGVDAEGAITIYRLDSGFIDPITGVGIFDKTGVTTTPP